jgi:hypothetical protein
MQTSVKIPGFVFQASHLTPDIVNQKRSTSGD